MDDDYKADGNIPVRISYVLFCAKRADSDAIERLWTRAHACVFLPAPIHRIWAPSADALLVRARLFVRTGRGAAPADTVGVHWSSVVLLGTGPTSLTVPGINTRFCALAHASPVIRMPEWPAAVGALIACLAVHIFVLCWRTVGALCVASEVPLK